jgi:pimeloyl-ACP methyl ester carboxylesterase
VETVETAEGPVAYERAGEGPPLVLLHACPGDHRDYAAVHEALARSHAIYAIDWPGFGASPPPAVPTRASAMLYARVLATFVDALDLHGLRLVGNSVGGYAAASLAIDQPDRVERLVLVNSNGFTRHTPLTRAVCRLLGNETATRRLSGLLARCYLRRSNDTVRAMRRRAAAPRPERAAVQAALWRSFTEPDNDLRARAAAITAPTLVVWGRRDPLLPLRRDGRHCRRALPGARFTVVPTGHAAFAEDPAGFLALVEPFLLDASAAPPVRAVERPGAGR